MGVLLFGWASGARAAGTVSYTFSGTNAGDGLPVAFTFTSQGFILSSTSLLSAQLSSCTNCLVSNEVPAVVLEPANGNADTIQFDDNDSQGGEYSFPLGSLTTLGIYTSKVPYNPGTLTVSVVGPYTIDFDGGSCGACVYHWVPSGERDVQCKHDLLHR